MVSVFANAACGGLRAENPQARTAANAVALSWSWVNPDGAPMAACKCTRHLEFRVEGVPAGDVTVTAEAAAPAPKLPDDVTRFVSRRQSCDHFRGEEPYSAERRAQLELALGRDCRGTDRELSSLRTKYGGNAAILKILAEYETEIEAK